MKIINHYLYTDDNKQVQYRKSPNIGGSLNPKYIIIHYTASANAEGAISWMLSSKSQVSAHLHIDRDGNIIQLVPFNKVAWHAGVSEWKGLKGLNSYSIGIELQNTGNQEYTQAQLDANLEACKAIKLFYGIDDILGHSDVSPGRKTDPGKQFPMIDLKTQLFNKIESKYTTSNLNLRVGPGTQHSILSVLPKGTEVNIIREEGDWVQIFTCNSKLTGFVNKQYLK